MGIARGIGNRVIAFVIPSVALCECPACGKTTQRPEEGYNWLIFPMSCWWCDAELGADRGEILDITDKVERDRKQKKSRDEHRKFRVDATEVHDPPFQHHTWEGGRVKDRVIVRAPTKELANYHFERYKPSGVLWNYIGVTGSSSSGPGIEVQRETTVAQ